MGRCSPTAADGRIILHPCFDPPSPPRDWRLLASGLMSSHYCRAGTPAKGSPEGVPMSNSAGPSSDYNIPCCHADDGQLPPPRTCRAGTGGHSLELDPSAAGPPRVGDSGPDPARSKPQDPLHSGQVWRTTPGEQSHFRPQQRCRDKVTGAPNSCTLPVIAPSLSTLDWPVRVVNIILEPTFSVLCQ